jgi:hypothetical protein
MTQDVSPCDMPAVPPRACPRPWLPPALTRAQPIDPYGAGDPVGEAQPRRLHRIANRAASDRHDAVRAFQRLHDANHVRTRGMGTEAGDRQMQPVSQHPRHLLSELTGPAQRIDGRHHDLARWKTLQRFRQRVRHRNAECDRLPVGRRAPTGFPNRTHDGSPCSAADSAAAGSIGRLLSAARDRPPSVGRSRIFSPSGYSTNSTRTPFGSQQTSHLPASFG